jgi:hypothetical protein
MGSLNGHETGNSRYCQGNTYGNSPFPGPTMTAVRGLGAYIDPLYPKNLAKPLKGRMTPEDLVRDLDPNSILFPASLKGNELFP